MSAVSSNGRAAVTIIGKTPPPIGGVTIHVSRLLRRLAEEGVPFIHFDPAKDRWSTLFSAVLRGRAIHVHVSNSYLRVFLVLLSAVLRRKSLITLHGNLGRYGATRNGFDNAAVWLADRPILLNSASLSAALALNPNSELVPAFIPPSSDLDASGEVGRLIADWKGGRAPLFCSNAHARVSDKDGADIYCVESLLEVFSGLPDAGLVFSDPSGTYSEYFDRSGTVVPQNVLMISEPHSFLEVLSSCDCMIRATTTDGDSISVKEALYLGVNVIASDCVPRPPGCLIYPTSDSESLARIVKEFERSEVSYLVEDAVPLLINAYRSLGVGLAQ